jgi:hypothetical protein
VSLIAPGDTITIPTRIIYLSIYLSIYIHTYILTRYVCLCVYVYLYKCRTYMQMYIHIYRVTNSADVGATITITTRSTGTHPLGHISRHQAPTGIRVWGVRCRVIRPRASTAKKKRFRDIFFDTMVLGVGCRVIRPPGKMSRTNLVNYLRIKMSQPNLVNSHNPGQHPLELRRIS